MPKVIYVDAEGFREIWRRLNPEDRYSFDTAPPMGYPVPLIDAVVIESPTQEPMSVEDALRAIDEAHAVKAV